MSDASLTTIAATTIPERTGTAGGITSFVPLTSAFTANPTCSDLFVNYPNSAHLMGWDPSYGEKADAFYDCNPSIVSQWFAQSEKSGMSVAPGETGISMGPFTCPSGWSTVATVTRSSSSTIAECCPPSYSLINNPLGGKAGNCVMAVSSGQILTYASPTASSLYHIFTTTMTSRSTVGAFAITGWNVNYVRSLASSTSTSTSSDNTTSDATSGNSSTSAISGGAIAGIVVGVIAGVSLLAMALFIFMRRRRKQHQETTHAEADSTQPMQPEELHGQDLPHEMDHAHMVAELPTEHETRYELDGQEDSEEKNK